MERANRVQWFRMFREATAGLESSACDLLTQVRVAEPWFSAILEATAQYLGACLGARGPRSGEAVRGRLEQAVDSLANRTPNGEVLPKQEFEEEFNRFHRAVAAWLGTLGIDHLLSQLSCPVAVRVVKGTAEPQVEGRPYASSKMHVDLWNGDPPDSINVLLPLWGDVDRTSVEFYGPPADFEERFLCTVRDYEEAAARLGPCERYPVTFRLGHAHFMDAVVPHRTVRRGGGVRVSIQLQLRRRVSEAARARAEAICDAARLAGYYLPPAEWYAVGTTRFMRFHDTYADAQRGRFVQHPYREAMYHLADSL